MNLHDTKIMRDTIYVLDRTNKEIKIYDTNGNSLGTWNISSNSDPMFFSLNRNYAFILDRQNNAVLKYTLSGDSISALSEIGGNNFKELKAITSSSDANRLYILDSIRSAILPIVHGT